MANRYWVGGTANWDNSTTTHWSTSSGGGGGASVPGISDDVFLNGSSGGGTITPNYDLSVNSITCGAFTGTLDFSVNNNSPTMGLFSGTGTGARTIKMGSGTWTLTGSGTVWDCSTTTNLTLNCNISTIKLTGGSGFNDFYGGGLTYYNFWNAMTGYNTNRIIIRGSNTFNNFKANPDSWQEFIAGTTTTISSLTANGTITNPIAFQGYTSSTWTISDTTGTNTVDYCNISYSTASGGATFNATNSTDGGNNSGWNFITSTPTNAGFLFNMI